MASKTPTQLGNDSRPRLKQLRRHRLAHVLRLQVAIRFVFPNAYVGSGVGYCERLILPQTVVPARHREGQELADSPRSGTPHKRGFLFLGMTGYGHTSSYASAPGRGIASATNGEFPHKVGLLDSFQIRFR